MDIRDLELTNRLELEEKSEDGDWDHRCALHRIMFDHEDIAFNENGEVRFSPLSRVLSGTAHSSSFYGSIWVKSPEAGDEEGAEGDEECIDRVSVVIREMDGNDPSCALRGRLYYSPREDYADRDCGFDLRLPSPQFEELISLINLTTSTFTVEANIRAPVEESYGPPAFLLNPKGGSYVAELCGYYVVTGGLRKFAQDDFDEYESPEQAMPIEQLLLQGLVNIQTVAASTNRLLKVLIALAVAGVLALVM